MEKLTDILVAILKITDKEANRDFSMSDVDTWDSLSHMELIVAIEEKFKIELSGDDIVDMVSFASIREVLAKYEGKADG